MALYPAKNSAEYETIQLVMIASYCKARARLIDYTGPHGMESDKDGK